MERRPPWCRAPPDPLSGPQLLGLLLFPWTLQLAGGQLVTHIGAPIMVSLANEAISFGCKISYPHSPELKNFTAWYFHVDLQSQRSSEKQINCSSHPVKENQTHSLKCWVTPQLPNASATGTYYCSVHWPDVIRISEGIFILVRDTGYQEPPQGAQKLLLFCFTGLLTLLSILVTALLLWKKGQMRAPPKHLDPGTAHGQEQPVAESIYTSLQGRDTEVYSCIQTVPSSLPPKPELCLPAFPPYRKSDGLMTSWLAAER
uniref:NFAT activation molecule 1 isoform X1 n=2 Tax=Panthera onca TaxID=9690 RepID=UPI002953998D|nr:NFAT activation molecule 1 isoform X1 [Panthera onca]